LEVCRYLEVNLTKEKQVFYIESKRKTEKNKKQKKKPYCKGIKAENFLFVLRMNPQINGSE
jgi:hypothetical protein